MLKKTIERLFYSYPRRGTKAKMRLDLLESSNVIAHLGCTEESEEDPEFPEKEACKLFKHCQWIACFHPGIDAEILRSKKYKTNVR
jgi:hypothetical protein